MAIFRKLVPWLLLAVLSALLLLQLRTSPAFQPQAVKCSTKFSAEKKDILIQEVALDKHEDTREQSENDYLLLEFLNKLSAIPKTAKPTQKDCKLINSTDAPCANLTCPASFSPSPDVRLRQILATRTYAYQSFRPAVTQFTKDIQFSQYIFVTAVSSNHYREMQALLKNLFENVFPRMSSFTFLLVDIGLSISERNLTEKYCRCSVVDFPFDMLPTFFRELKCATWKPFIIKALQSKAEYVIWMDASIRWKSTANFTLIFQRAKKMGALFMFNDGSIAVRTSSSTFEFYGDISCQYSGYNELESGFGVYHNQPFVQKAILDPWMSCAFDRRCMCVDNYKKFVACRRIPPRRDSRCHRFDQSSLNIIVTKLFLEQRGAHIFPANTYTVQREHKIDFFKNLTNM